MRWAVVFLIVPGCAHERAALPSWATQPEPGFSSARYVVAIGTAERGDIEAARAASRRAVAEQVRSQLEAETRRSLRAWSSRGDGDPKSGSEHQLAADVSSRTSFSRAELIEVVRVHVDPDSGRVYALGVLDRLRAAQALEADLDAALHRARTRLEAARKALRRIERVLRLGAARQALVDASAIALELAAVKREPDVALAVLRQAADVEQETAAVKAETPWKIELRTPQADAAEHLTLVHDGAVRALSRLGFAIGNGTDLAATVLAVGTVRTHPSGQAGRYHCRAGVDLVATEAGEVVAEVHRDRVDTSMPQPRAEDACRLALTLLADTLQTGLERALEQRAEEP